MCAPQHDQMKKIIRSRLFSSFIILTLFSISCENRQEAMRIYDEVVIESPWKASGQNPHTLMGNLGTEQPQQMPVELSQMPVTVNASVPISWITPKDWLEQKGSGLRLATFKSKNADSIECSIVSLGREAGDLKSNVLRWMKQINLSLPSDDRLQEFLAQQSQWKTSSGLAYRVIDFTQLPASAETSNLSMISAIFETDTVTIFAKLTGTKNEIIQNKEQFLSLCNSITVKP